MNIEVRPHDDREVLVQSLASAFIDVLAAAQAQGRIPHVALTGGSVANDLYAHLATLAEASPVDWARVVWWWGDERFVPHDSPDRNALQARRAMLDHVGVDPAHVHEMPANGPALTLEAAAASYGDELRAGGSGEFDLVLLGVGPDGHCASLFPFDAALDVDDTVAVGVPASPKPPPERITLTFGALNRAARVWFVVAGADKAAAVRALTAAPGEPGATVTETPARGVQGRLATVLWTDREALGH